MEPTKKPYRTTDFYLACYLRFRGYDFVGVTFDANRRATFEFAGVGDSDLLSYYNKEKQEVAFIDVVIAVKQTRELLYNMPSA